MEIRSKVAWTWLKGKWAALMIYHLAWSLCNQLRFIETEIRYDGGQSMFGKDKHNSVNERQTQEEEEENKQAHMHAHAVPFVQCK